MLKYLSICVNEKKGVNWASHNFLALLKDALGGKQCSVEGHQWAQEKG